MFGIGGTELFLIALVALLLFGPDKLPQFARTIGRFLRDFKRYQDIMESTIRAEMYVTQDDRPDPFKKGKDFRERVQAEKAAKAAEAEKAAEPEEPKTSDEQTVTVDEGTAESDDGKVSPQPDTETPLSDAEGEGERSGADEA